MMAARQNPTLAVAVQTSRGATLDVTIARQAFLPTLTVDAVYGIEANAIALKVPLQPLKRSGPCRISVIL